MPPHQPLAETHAARLPEVPTAAGASVLWIMGAALVCVVCGVIYTLLTTG